jgi:GDP-4-dehydro-6-deoxy-D-mannose reductase
VDDVLRDLLRLAGVTARIEQTPAELRPTDLRETPCSADLARGLLAWKPAVPWERTLRDTINFWRDAIHREAA